MSVERVCRVNGDVLEVLPEEFPREKNQAVTAALEEWISQHGKDGVVYQAICVRSPKMQAVATIRARKVEE